MAVFAYKATDRRSGETRGTIVADTPRQARDILRAQGLAIRGLNEQTAKRRGLSSKAGVGRVSAAHVNAFYRELSTLLGAGIPLLEALDTVTRQHEGRFKAALLMLRDRVSAGVSLHAAMGEQPGLFDPLAQSIVEVGEGAGTLDGCLQRLAEFKEKSQQLKGRIGTALLYPLIVLGMGLLVGLFLMTYVVPGLLTVLVESGKELPVATRVVKSISDFLLQRWWLLLAGLMVLGLLGARMSRSAKAVWRFHALQLRVPMLGDLIRKQAIARLAMVIATLTRSGVTFTRALQMAQKATGNSVLRQALVSCETAVLAGRDIAVALEASRDGKGRPLMPPMVIQIFAVGQASGRLEEMLERLSTDYDQQVSVAAQRFTAILEPIIILILAVVVGFIAFATILPILEAGNVL